MAKFTAADLRNRFHAFMDPKHRQRMANARSAVSEASFREDRSEVVEDRKAFVNTAAFRELELSLLAECRRQIGTVPGLDAAGAYWRREGIESALEMLDLLRKQAELETEHEI